MTNDDLTLKQTNKALFAGHLLYFNKRGYLYLEVSYIIGSWINSLIIHNIILVTIHVHTCICLYIR